MRIELPFPEADRVMQGAAGLRIGVCSSDTGLLVLWCGPVEKGFDPNNWTYGDLDLLCTPVPDKDTAVLESASYRGNAFLGGLTYKVTL